MSSTVRPFALYVALGMSPMEALQSATRVAAELIGVNEDRGTIEAGKRADLIAVASNPLRDIRQLENVRFVMKAGAIVKHDLECVEGAGFRYFGCS